MQRAENAARRRWAQKFPTEKERGGVGCRNFRPKRERGGVECKNFRPQRRKIFQFGKGTGSSGDTSRISRAITQLSPAIRPIAAHSTLIEPAVHMKKQFTQNSSVFFP